MGPEDEGPEADLQADEREGRLLPKYLNMLRKYYEHLVDFCSDSTHYLVFLNIIHHNVISLKNKFVKRSLP